MHTKSSISLDFSFKPKKLSNRIIKITSSVFRLVILCSIGYIIMYPLFFMVTSSFKSIESYYGSAKVWIPDSIAPLYNFSFALQLIDYWNSLKSTILYEMVAAGIEIMSCSVAAYGFSRFNFKFKRIFVICLFLTIIIPETMLLIPRMVNYSNLDFIGMLGFLNKATGIDIRPNIINTPLAFYLPSLFAIGLRSGILIYIFIQFFNGLPYELEEAACVDGAGPIRTFVKIALPSSSVVFVTVTVFAVIWHWNDTQLASIYLKSNYPLAVNLSRITETLAAAGFSTQYDVSVMSIIMAACLCFVLLVLIMYLILQRKFIESIDRVGITG